MNTLEFAYNPGWVWLLAAFIGLGVVFYLSYLRGLSRTQPRQRLLLIGLRLTAVAVVVVCLLDPRRVDENREYEPGRIAVLLDNSRSMSWNEGGVTRFDLARNWLENELTPPDGFNTLTFGFSTNLIAVENPDAMAPRGNATLIGKSLESLWTGSGRNPFSSVVLISDGHDHSADSVEEVARRFGRGRVPIHVLPLGSTNEPPDIVLEHVSVRRPVPQQALTKARITLRSPGLEGQTVPLRIHKDGRILAERMVNLAGSRQQLEIDFHPGERGFQTFTTEIPARPGERMLENNRREFGVTVVDQVLRVIYMEGSGVQRGVFQPLYLKHALEETPGIETKTLYCDQHGSPPSLHHQVAATDPRNGDKIYRVQHSTLGFPRTLEELLQYDVIVSSDIPKEAFTEEQLKNTERFVTEFGGGFVMVGGHTAFGSGQYNRTVIDRILPVETNLEQDTVSNHFKPLLGPEALHHPLMQIGDSEQANLAIWTQKFPMLLGFNRVDRAKPGAVVLLQHPQVRTRAGPAVILAAQEIGKGRSMAFTSDTTFLWGDHFQTLWGEPIHANRPLSEQNCDARYYKQFWVNAVRWLSANKFHRDQNLLVLEMARSHGAPGQDLPFTADLFNGAGEKVSDADVVVRLMEGDKEIARVKPRFQEGTGSYRGSIRLDAPGKYVIRASAQITATELAESQALVVCEEMDQEWDDIRAKPELLRDIARWSGGLDLSELEKNPRAIKNALGGAQPFTVKYRRASLWDRTPWLIFLIGLLTAEWVLRRKSGLA
jgi:uncharacterized membrane protein